MLLVPVRQYILPKFFTGAHLQDLDAAEYEEVLALPFDLSAVSRQTSPYLSTYQGFLGRKEMDKGVQTINKHVMKLHEILMTLISIT